MIYIFTDFDFTEIFLFLCIIVILISTGKKEITIPSDDEPKGIIAPLKEKYSEIKG